MIFINEPIYYSYELINNIEYYILTVRIDEDIFIIIQNLIIKKLQEWLLNLI